MRDVRRGVRALERLKLRWTSVLAAMQKAAVSLEEGQRNHAIRFLRDAVELAEENNMLVTSTSLEGACSSLGSTTDLPNTRCGPAACSGVRASTRALLPQSFVLPIVRKGAGRRGTVCRVAFAERSPVDDRMRLRSQCTSGEAHSKSPRR